MKGDNLKNRVIDYIILIIMIISILLSGNILVKILPRQLPTINSVVLDFITPKDGEFDFKNIKNKKNMPKMFITYNLAALESSQNRKFNYENDLKLFMSIAKSLPMGTQVKMFRFSKDKLEMDVEADSIKIEEFCNNLNGSEKIIVEQNIKTAKEGMYTILCDIIAK